LSADAYGSMGAAWGKWYARFARKLVPDRRKVAHSWRHTVATKLRRAGVREDVMDELLGWTSAKMNRRYGTGFGVGTLKESVERIRCDVLRGGSFPARESSPLDSPP
jgi:integrase